MTFFILYDIMNKQKITKEKINQMIEFIQYIQEFLNTEPNLKINDLTDLFPGVVRPKTIKALKIFGFIRATGSGRNIKYFWIDDLINPINEFTAEAILKLTGFIYKLSQQEFIDLLGNEFRGKIDFMNDEIDWGAKVSKNSKEINVKGSRNLGKVLKDINEKFDLPKVEPNHPAVIDKANPSGILFSMKHLSIVEIMKVGGVLIICDNLRLFDIDGILFKKVDFDKNKVLIEAYSSKSQSKVIMEYTFNDTKGLFIDRQTDEMRIKINREL